MFDHHKKDIDDQRFLSVKKSNDLVRQAKYDLSIQELKVLAYIMSKVKPTDQEFQEYKFNIREYCEVCGIDLSSGKNYTDIKNTLKSMHDKSFWIMDENGNEVLMSWIQKARIGKGSGTIKVRLDEDIQKYLIGLWGNYTQYELISVLPMKSTYSFRMYELLKSYAYNKTHTFPILELKKLMCAEHYEDFCDFRRKVLEVATREINLYTDLEVSWSTEKWGKKVTAVVFDIETLDGIRLYHNVKNAKEEIEGQITLADIIK